jgi:hypothetical protein
LKFRETCQWGKRIERNSPETANAPLQGQVTDTVVVGYNGRGEGALVSETLPNFQV